MNTGKTEAGRSHRLFIKPTNDIPSLGPILLVRSQPQNPFSSRSGDYIGCEPRKWERWEPLWGLPTTSAEMTATQALGTESKHNRRPWRVASQKEMMSERHSFRPSLGTLGNRQEGKCLSQTISRPKPLCVVFSATASLFCHPCTAKSVQELRVGAAHGFTASEGISRSIHLMTSLGSRC